MSSLHTLPPLDNNTWRHRVRLAAEQAAAPMEYSDLTVDEVSTPGQRPVLKVKINNTVVPCLFDTGANVSVLSYDAFRRLRDRPRLLPAVRAIRAANGQFLKVMGRVLLNYSWDDIHFRHLAYVIRDVTSDAIIGTDAMAAEDLIVDPGKGQVHRRSHAGLRIRLCRATTIPPQAEMAVRCTVIGADRQMTGQMITVSLMAKLLW